MWPGSDLPPNQPPPEPAYPPPPPQGAGPGPVTPKPPPIKPGGGWYALPLTLVGIALLGFLVVFATNWSDSEAADGPRAAGDPDTGLTVELKTGHAYFVYVRSDDSFPTSCALTTAGAPAPVPLTRDHGWASSDHTGYQYAATFEAPLTGRAKLTCQGVSRDVLMTPDDTSYAYLGLAFLAALVLSVVAAIAFTVIAVMRRASVNRRAAAPY